MKKQRRTWPWGVAIALLPVLVLAASVVYKFAIGFTSFHAHVDDWVYPRKLTGLMQPLERMDLPEFRGATTAIEGVPLPGGWTGQVVQVDATGWFKIKVEVPDDESISITVHPIEAKLIGTEFQIELQGLPDQYAGDWDSFVALFGSDMELLEQVFGSDVPNPLASSMLPLFPPVKNYKHQSALLTAKALTCHGGRLLFLRGRKRFFLVDFAAQEDGAVVMLGPLDTRHVDGELAISRGKELSEAVLFEICGSLDAGDFAPRIPPTVPENAVGNAQSPR